MISVVICSVNKIMLSNITNNIIESIGVPFEILSVDNSYSNRGISAVYNDLGNKAIFDIICFIHEDVIIHTKNWGDVLVKLFLDKKLGLVGISGATYKSKYPGTWSACDISLYRTHSIQHFKHLEEPQITNINPDNVTHTEVAVIDGVFMATSKIVFKEHNFDELLLKNFHLYDLDFSVNVGINYNVVVSYEILIEHLSEGNLDKNWILDSLKIHKKWKDILPVNICNCLHPFNNVSDYKSCTCVLNNALKVDKINIVLRYYFLCISKFFLMNKFLYTKTIFKYLIQKTIP